MYKKCSRCHYHFTHPFGLTIVKDTCSGCITHNEKYVIDWEERYLHLKNLTTKVKNNRVKRKYDCIVPVQGDAEDFYTLSKVLELGLSPLVVVVNDYFRNDVGWHNIHQLITHFDVDSYLYNPDIRVYKDLVRTSLRKYEHFLLPYIQLHSSFAIHMACEKNIPLVIWGQNQAIEQTGKFSHYDMIEMTKWYRKEHDLFDVDIEDLIGNGAQVDTRSLGYYHYPDIKFLKRRGVRGLYLSNYMHWDPLKQNCQMLEYGFKPQRNNASFDVYDRAGSSVYYSFHDLLKMKRCGYRKISDHVAREIRHGRISSQEGLELISEYNKTKVFIKPFFDWLGVTKSGYDWFKLHRLKEVESLISENHIDYDIELPNEIYSKVAIHHTPSNNFMLFGKGIDI